MQTQSSERHRRWSRPHHFVLLPVIFVGMVGSTVNLYYSLGNHERLYSASLIVFAMVTLGMVAVLGRWATLRVQDRAIRAEENLRHFALTGHLLDPRLTLRQIIGLRFAADEEFAQLARRAADENLSLADIKMAVKHWRPDYHRA